MKLSQFNVYVEKEQELMIYNTLSGGVLALNKDYSDKFAQFRFDNNVYVLNDELRTNLETGKMIIDDEFDELSFVEVIRQLSRYKSDSLSLTIAPTTKCNFACSYCYEKGIEGIDMNDNVEKKLAAFIEGYLDSGRRNLFVVWYGGEPLLRLDIIRHISDLILKKNCFYDAQIVTNGYLLTRENALILKNCGVQSAQITLDGGAQSHDQRRFLKNGEGTFSKILDNIKICCDILNIAIRVNVDKDNIEQLPELISALDSYELKNKVHVYLAPIDNKEGANYDIKKCFNDKEFSSKVLEFYTQYMNSGYIHAALPHFNPFGCGAINSSSFVIDAKGDLYKCWDDIGFLKEKIGNISEKIDLNQLHLKWLSFNVLDDEECRKCEILPICMGGCANRSIKGKNKKCNLYKYHTEKYLDLAVKEKLCQQFSKTE